MADSGFSAKYVPDEEADEDTSIILTIHDIDFMKRMQVDLGQISMQ